MELLVLSGAEVFLIEKKKGLYPDKPFHLVIGYSLLVIETMYDMS